MQGPPEAGKFVAFVTFTPPDRGVHLGCSPEDLRTRPSSLAIYLLKVCALTATALAFALGQSAHAQASWSTTPANGQMTNGANWVGGVAPADGSAWVFTNSSTLALTNGFVGYNVGGLSFTAAGNNFALTGNAFTLTGNITNASTSQVKISNNLTVNSSILISNTTSGHVTLGGVLSGSGTVTYGAASGSGRLVLQGPGLSDFSGSLIANSGRVNTGPNQTSDSADYTFNNSGGTFLTVADSVYNFGTLSGNATIAVNSLGFSNTVSVGAKGGSTAFSGNISSNQSGTISVIKVGAGTLTLSGANTYVGATTISNGVLQIGNGGTTGSIANTASIALDGGSLAINRSDTLTQGVDFTNAAITGTGGLIQMGSGTTVLTAANSFSGDTVISAGVLQIGNGGSDGSLSASSAITNDGSLVFHRSDNVAQGTDFSSTAITGTGTLVKRGAGTLTLNEANTYSGPTSLEEGTIIFSANNALGSGTVTMADGTALSGSGGTRVIGNNIVVNGDVALNDQDNGGSFNGNIDLTGGTRQINVASSSTFNGVISNGSLVMDSTASFRSMTLTAANTFDDVTVLRGILRLSGSGSLSAGGAVSLAPSIATSTLDISSLDGASTTIGSLAGTTISALVNLGSKELIVGGNNASTTFAGIISNTGSVTKTGSGTLTLSASNTYTGATTVSGGELAVNGSIAGSAVTVQSGAVLSGSGTVGSTTISSGATISPGNSPGIQSINGDLTWSGGGNYDWEIFNLAGPAGTGWDVIDVSDQLLLGSLSSGNKFNINIYSLSGINPDVPGALSGWDSSVTNSWTIVRTTNGITGFDAANFNVNTAGFTAYNNVGTGLFALALDGNDLKLVFSPGATPVPEPGTWAAGALLALAAGLAARRRARRSEAPQSGSPDTHV